MKSSLRDFLEYLPRLRRVLEYYVPQLTTGRNNVTFRFLLFTFFNIFRKSIEGKDQLDLLNSDEWDILIILDACRYDYFQEEYSNFLHGKLLKARSPGSSTGTWLKRSLDGYYPKTQVISANPHLNSKGILVTDYDPLEHFPSENIIDVWERSWNEELNTVHPKEVVKATLSNVYDQGRQIIWFIQPHGPWIGNPKISFPILGPATAPEKSVVPLLRSGEIDLEIFKKAYRGNLRLVLRYVSLLLKKISERKNVIVTSDHGELLGSYDSYLHFANLPAPELREVPYLRVE